MAATGRGCPVIRLNEGRGVVIAEGKEDRLAAQAVFGRFVAGAGGHGPVEKPDLLKNPDRSSYLVLGEPKIRTTGERPPINREGIDNPAWHGPETGQEDRQGEGCLSIAE
jgi:hypothetical protein